jgi:hypothetical protein
MTQTHFQHEQTSCSDVGQLPNLHPKRPGKIAGLPVGTETGNLKPLSTWSGGTPLNRAPILCWCPLLTIRLRILMWEPFGHRESAGKCSLQQFRHFGDRTGRFIPVRTRGRKRNFRDRRRSGYRHDISSDDDGDFLAVDQADFGIDSVSVEAESSYLSRSNQHLPQQQHDQIPDGLGPELHLRRRAYPKILHPSRLFHLASKAAAGAGPAYSSPNQPISMVCRVRFERYLTFR